MYRSILTAAAAVAVAAITLVTGCASETGSTPVKTTQAPTSSGPISASSNTEHPPVADVTLKSCASDEIGFVTAKGTIVNHSSKPSEYAIDLEFVAGGARYAEGFATASAVAPGQTVEWEASGLEDNRPGTVCRVLSVDRFAS